MTFIISLFEFLFRFVGWVVITVGCLVYALWAVLKDRIRRYNQHADEVEEVVQDLH